MKIYPATTIKNLSYEQKCNLEALGFIKFNGMMFRASSDIHDVMSMHRRCKKKYNRICKKMYKPGTVRLTYVKMEDGIIAKEITGR